VTLGPIAYCARALPLPGTAPAHLLETSAAHFGHTISLVIADGSTPPASLRTSAAAFHTPEQLVVFFEGRYASLRTSSTTRGQEISRKTPDLWEKSDVFEFFIGSRARETQVYKEFQVAPDGLWLDFAVFHHNGKFTGDQDWHSGCRCLSAIDEENKIWRSLIQIPWKAITGGQEPESDWHCNFYRASGRFHGDELLAWSPTGLAPGSFHRTECFGTLVIES
jgi:hypothetical protein